MVQLESRCLPNSQLPNDLGTSVAGPHPPPAQTPSPPADRDIAALENLFLLANDLYAADITSGDYSNIDILRPYLLFGSVNPVVPVKPRKPLGRPLNFGAAGGAQNTGSGRPVRYIKPFLSKDINNTLRYIPEYPDEIFRDSPQWHAWFKDLRSRIDRTMGPLIPAISNLRRPIVIIYGFEKGAKHPIVCRVKGTATQTINNQIKQAFGSVTLPRWWPTTSTITRVNCIPYTIPVKQP